MSGANTPFSQGNTQFSAGAKPSAYMNPQAPAPQNTDYAMLFGNSGFDAASPGYQSAMQMAQYNQGINNRINSATFGQLANIPRAGSLAELGSKYLASKNTDGKNANQNALNNSLNIISAFAGVNPSALQKQTAFTPVVAENPYSTPQITIDPVIPAPMNPPISAPRTSTWRNISSKSSKKK